MPGSRTPVGVRDLAAQNSMVLSSRCTDSAAGSSDKAVGAEEGAFLLQEFIDGSLGHGFGRGRGHLFHVVASRSRSAPTSSWTRRVRIFPHPLAIGSTPVRSIDADVRKGMAGPSLDFGRRTIWGNSA